MAAVTIGSDFGAQVKKFCHCFHFFPFSCPQSFTAWGSFQMSQLFTSGCQRLEFQLQHQSFQRNPRADLLQNGLVGSPCSPRDSQESSPTPLYWEFSIFHLWWHLHVFLSSKYMCDFHKRNSEPPGLHKGYIYPWSISWSMGKIHTRQNVPEILTYPVLALWLTN